MLLGSAYGKVTIDASGVKKGVTQATTDLKKLAAVGVQVGNTLKNVGRTMTLTMTLPILAAGGAAIKAASSLEEARNKVQVVFGDMGASMLEWSKTSAEVFGQSQRQALEAAGTFGNFFTAMGIGIDKSAEMSKTLTQLASDLASFNDIDPSEALLKLQAGLAGETEPLRRLGVDLTMARVRAKALEMGLADASGELSQQALILARYAVIMEQTSAAQGDYLRTQDSFANSTRGLQADLEDMLATLGQELLPVAIEVVGQLRELVQWFTNLSPKTQENIIKLAGLVAVMGPILSVVGSLVTTISSLMGIMSGLGVTLPAVGAGLSGIGAAITGTMLPALGAFLVAAGPVLLMLAAIAAGVYAIYYVFKHNIGGITTTVQQLWWIIQYTFGQIAEAAFNLGVQLGTALKGGLDSLVEFFRTKLTQVLDFFKNLREKIGNVFKQDWSQFGKLIILGIVKGMMGGLGWLASAVMAIAATILGGLKKSLGIRSPSSKAAWFGEMTGKGYIQGLSAALSGKQLENLLNRPVQQISHNASSTSQTLTVQMASGLTVKQAGQMIAMNREEMLRTLEKGLSFG